MGKAKKPKKRSHSDQTTDMEVEHADNYGEPTTAKEKMRQKMDQKKTLKAQVEQLKKTRTKIGKAKERRNERRTVTQKLKELKGRLTKDGGDAAAAEGGGGAEGDHEMSA
mmetsp:Transcript_24542/g.58341  ORF Transcript_24542/g.58341 Transcript_24542/m.58341 type:complete len:110 (-) Transcript_24542:41-370(-)